MRSCWVIGWTWWSQGLFQPGSFCDSDSLGWVRSRAGKVQGWGIMHRLPSLLARLRLELQQPSCRHSSRAGTSHSGGPGQAQAGAGAQQPFPRAEPAHRKGASPGSTTTSLWPWCTKCWVRLVTQSCWAVFPGCCACHSPITPLPWPWFPWSTYRKFSSKTSTIK